MPPGPHLAVFIDRDGTLTIDPGYLSSPEGLVLQPQAKEAVGLLRQAGARLFLTTNQSGIARGLFSEEELARIHVELERRLGGAFDAIYYCPHHPTEGKPPYRKSCDCRKPGTGLLERGLSEWGLNAEDCYMLGDKDIDILAGQRLGIRTVLVPDAHADSPAAAPAAAGELPHPDHTAAGLLEAARWILRDAELRGKLSSNRPRSEAQAGESLKELISKLLRESAGVKLAMVEQNSDAIQRAAELIVTSLRAGGKLLTCGNGGSAADAQHIAAELSGRYLKDRPGLAGVALTTNSSALTAIANDYGFEMLFSRQLDGFCRPGDVVLGISTSGNSPNIVKALARARELGARTIAFTGARKCRLDELADVLLKVPSESTPRIQEGHIAAGHIICHIVEERLSD